MTFILTILNICLKVGVDMQITEHSVVNVQVSDEN